MIILKTYQENAIHELISKLKKLLSYEGRFTISFKAPTGSGKTLMVSEVLTRLAGDISNRAPLSFVWISVRSLPEQSKNKLEGYLLNNNSIKCSYFEELQDRKINENEILFINWESINKKNINIIIRENEQNNNLNSVIKNTKEEGRKIILVIDESHHTANADRSRALINIIDPAVTLEVSATPVQKVYDESVTVHLPDVKEEHMIKSEVAVNPKFLGLEVENKSSDEVIIEQAIETRERLLSQLKKEGSIVNPLLLIQLPDKRSELDEKKEDVIKLLDSKFGINESNGKLAIWLSEDKSPSLVDIEKPDNKVEVLIFKQAIALGWDCPRASILVIFRELRSFTFTIQTVGRIMRMPELRYYKSDELNKAYVFTNLQNVLIEGDELQDYITVDESHRDNRKYHNISLRSVSVKRLRERTRLSGEFVKIFQKVASETNLQENINTTPESISDFIIADGKINNIDQMGNIESQGSISIKSKPEEIDRKFELFVWKNCSPYAPAYSSDRIKNAIYTFLKEKFEIEKYSEQAQTIAIGTENVKLFEETLQIAKETYQKDVVEKLNRRGEFIEEPQWEIPEFISYNEKYYVFSSAKSIMQPFYKYKDASKPEVNFMKLLDNSDKVKWWFKNREGEPKYFSVGYVDDEGYNSAFYVDFIVQFNDGTIGLFDTKAGITASNTAAKAKAEALQKYIKDENSKGKKLRGGIVIPAGTSSFSWRINENPIYSDDFANLSNWKSFIL